MSLPKITGKQQEILKYIYHFRFLNRVQIQALLRHKDYKRINAWLKDSTEKEYLNRIFSIEDRNRTLPAVYYIGPNGIKFIKATVNCPKTHLAKLYRESDRSHNFINRCQLLGEIFLDLRRKNSDKIAYTITTSSGFSNPESPYSFLANTTFQLVIEEKSRVKTKTVANYYLLEIFEPTLPQYSIRKRIRDYIDFYYSNEWEENIYKKFPVILLVCPDLPVLIDVKRFAKRLINDDYGDAELRLQFTTEQKIREIGFNGDIWE